MVEIHSTSIVEEGALIEDNVKIGPFCIIGGNVKIGSGTTIQSHTVIEGITEIGENNTIYSFVSEISFLLFLAGHSSFFGSGDLQRCAPWQRKRRVGHGCDAHQLSGGQGAAKPRKVVHSPGHGHQQRRGPLAHTL